MQIQQFLEHHGITVNPFVDEDARIDPVFKEHCILDTHHPTWGKVYGNPAEPATSIVFGEKGSGKTAMRLQIARHVSVYNGEHPDRRVFLIDYDDFNPFLDRFRDRLSGRRRREGRVLAQWKLWDHMDAILSLGVTKLVDQVLGVPRPNATGAEEAGDLSLASLDRLQKRDLLLLAACYDQSSAEPIGQRWRRLRRKLRYSTWTTGWDLALGTVVSLAILALIVWLGAWNWLAKPWPYLAALAGWAPRLWRTWKWYWRARGIVRQVRVVNHEPTPLRRVLMAFPGSQIAGQPLPNHERTDDRYEFLAKFQGILATLGYSGIVVLVDRVDEPHLINGSVEQMRGLLWPMLDNKFLKHPGIGFKLFLPIELSQFIDREDRDFYQRARLDKQNLIPSLEWTGEALYDVANARIRACAAPGSTPTLRDLFDDSVSDRRLIDALRSLRVPRHLFKFMYRLFVAHANAYTDANPAWQIPAERFEAVLAVYQRDQDAVDRGTKAG
ncbi:MAG: hypothetical protein ACYC35_18795 [Pirellulales bacterium]